MECIYMELFKVNRGLTYVNSPYVEENEFLRMPAENNPLPLYENSKDKLPKPIWERHENAVECYNYAWKIAFDNLRTPNAEAGFVSNFIDTLTSTVTDLYAVKYVKAKTANNSAVLTPQERGLI